MALKDAISLCDLAVAMHYSIYIWYIVRCMVLKVVFLPFLRPNKRFVIPILKYMSKTIRMLTGKAISSRMRVSIGRFFCRRQQFDFRAQLAGVFNARRRSGQAVVTVVFPPPTGVDMSWVFVAQRVSILAARQFESCFCQPTPSLP